MTRRSREEPPAPEAQSPSRTHNERVLDFLEQLDERLAPAFPTMSPFWLSETRRFYTHPTAKTWSARVGRGGAKSTQIVKIAFAETIAGSFAIPPGEVHWFAIVSENKDEAAGRLRLIEALLDAMKMEYSRDGDSIVLKRPGWERRGFKVLAARLGAVSGFRAIGLAMDEVAKWNNDGTNPAAEIAASANAMLVTHPAAKRLAFSSPLAAGGLHYELVERGETARQIVSLAPTWVANPSISEERTHELEDDPRVWKREYLAEPQAGALAAFDPDLVERALANQVPDDYVRCSRVLLVDPTAGASDNYAYGFCRWRLDPERVRHILEFSFVGGIADASKRGLTSNDVVAFLTREARTRGVAYAHGDQFERFALASAFALRGITYIAHTWTAPMKERAVERVRTWLRDGSLSLPDYEPLRRELLAFEEKSRRRAPLRSGAGRAATTTTRCSCSSRRSST